MNMDKHITISDLSRLVKNKKISSKEIIDIFVDQSEFNEPTLNVWVTMDPDLAIKTALKCDEQIAAGQYKGPLHGIPLGVKDIYFTRDMPTTCCSPIYHNFRSEYDAEVVQLLREAGSIIMGKTVTTQFACGDPSPTKNPWNLNKTPGGSSSGSAVGVAAGYFPASIGSQTAGSVLRPAAFNGIVGFKPTHGLVSRYGQYPVSPSLDTVGWFTRTVRDSSILLQCLAGYDHRDNGSVYSEIPKYEIESAKNKPPKIGFVSQYYSQKSDVENFKSLESLVSKFEQAGAILEEIRIDISFEKLLDQHAVIMATEAARTHKGNFPSRAADYSPKVKDLIEKGLRISPVQYNNAITGQINLSAVIENILGTYDVLICPTAISGAPSPETTGDPSFQAIWTMSGAPTINLPYSLDDAGLPIGAQIIGRKFSERKLLSVAHWMENIIGFDKKPSE